MVELREFLEAALAASPDQIDAAYLVLNGEANAGSRQPDTQPIEVPLLTEEMGTIVPAADGQPNNHVLLRPSQELQKLPATESAQTYQQTISLKRQELSLEKRVFRKQGDFFRIVYPAGTEIFLQDLLGCRYLDYLVHHPGELITAFELETAVKQEKANARSINSIQAISDPAALKKYLSERSERQAERDKAAEENRQIEVALLDQDIQALDAQIKQNRNVADTGERARCNVSKAITAVLRNLAKGDAHEKQLGRHLSNHIIMGFSLHYCNPTGEIWH
jgi:hypothetical protein